jgi:hypothetical protein
VIHACAHELTMDGGGCKKKSLFLCKLAPAKQVSTRDQVYLFFFFFRPRRRVHRTSLCSMFHSLIAWHVARSHD